MLLSVYEFIEMCIDDDFNLEIWDNYSEEVIYSGPASEVDDEYLDFTVESFDPPRENRLTLNIDRSEDEEDW